MAHSKDMPRARLQWKQAPPTADPAAEHSQSTFVTALHDFSGARSASLSFTEGDVIEVIGTHESGWWDGIIVPNKERGWFPSNYVAASSEDEASWARAALGADDTASSTDEADSAEHSVRSRERTGHRSDQQPADALRSSNGISALQDHEEGSLEAIEHAVNLLEAAVEGERTSQFQPCTACIISSIRAMLSVSGCLTRESTLLRQFPLLAKERKQILSVLASLVTQARKSSSPTLDDAVRRMEADKMLQMAFQVLGYARRFLSVAEQCGPPGEQGHDADQGDDDTRIALKTRSLGDLRHAVRSNAMHSGASAEGFLATPAMSPASSRSPGLGPGRSLSSSSASSSAGPSTPEPQLLRRESDVSASSVGHTPLAAVHDQLLSSVAAFIGHVHAHSRSAHASSFTHLIDLTREIIERVREELSLLDALSPSPPTLAVARTSMYDAATLFVSAARSATVVEPGTVDDEDQEKQRLLSSATAVLRASNTCIAAIREGDVADEGLEETGAWNNAARAERRSPRTLSMLDRTTATLTALRSADGEDDHAAAHPVHVAQERSLSLARSSDGRGRPDVPLSARRGLAGPAPLQQAAPSHTSERVLRQSSDGLAAVGLSPSASVDSSERDYAPSEIVFNTEGSVVGGTVNSLVERLTLHDTTIDAAFAKAFMTTFRLFVDPLVLCRTLLHRFTAHTPMSVGLRSAASEAKAVAVRLRVYNALKTWLETYWRVDADSVVLEPLRLFVKEGLEQSVGAAAAERLGELIERRATEAASNGATNRARGMRRMASADLLRSASAARAGIFPMSGPSSSSSPTGQPAPPAPLVNKSLLTNLRNPLTASTLSPLDIDATELARQLTLLGSRIFCAIAVEELLGQEFSKKDSTRAANVRRMSAASTRITGWVAETLLGEDDARRRAQLLKYFIKLADRCSTLRNYDAVMAILAALNSSTISRLRRTWDGLSNKYRLLLEKMRQMTEHTRNFAAYRSMLRAADAPALPFLGLTLTDLTFPVERVSPLDPTLRLINFDRYHRIAKIVFDLQRFQQPYNLIEVPEICAWLTGRLANLESGGDVERLYRRSLLIEPRSEPASSGASSPTISFSKAWTFASSSEQRGGSSTGSGTFRAVTSV